MNISIQFDRRYMHTLVTEKTRVWVRVPGIYPYPTLTPD